MAESILFDLSKDLIVKLASAAIREVGLMWGVNDELDKLQDTLSSIQAVLHDAEEKQSDSHTVKNWVSKLKEVLYEIDDLIDESSYEMLRRQIMARDRSKRKQVRMLFSKFKSNWKLGHKIKEIRHRLNVINDDKTQFSFSEHVLIADTRKDELRKRRETHSLILDEEVIGRSDDKKKVIELLLKPNTNENVAIVSVVGMGGLGKTALAQSVYNHHMVAKHFELKLWVCISDEFDVKIIIQKIIESATGRKPKSFLQIDSLQSELRRQIDGNKYLLVMDDVWNEKHGECDSLKRLLMGGAKGSRILITTRSEQVARAFDTTLLHSLQKLDESNSWLLFKKMTLLEEEQLENSNLVEIGKEIVAKLKGNPLAIRTVGRLLHDKKTKIFWESFKDKELYQVMKPKDLEDILSILKLSYKYLPVNLKQCFLYCALFPKDYRIQKDELIRLWRAQGFIQPNDKDVGEECFMELLSRSFFQEVTTNKLGDIWKCKMHDLMHDLACSITGNECVRNGVKNEINKRTYHFSLGWISFDELKELPKTLSNARNMRTFFMLHYMHEVDLENIFDNHLQFRTLHLESSCIINLLVCKFNFGKLKHLRYLGITSLDLEELPKCITELYNLETLILIGWRELKKVPSDIKSLINLKHLDLTHNVKLEFLPNSITELCKLEALILAICEELKELPRDVKNWINLRHLDLSYNKSIEFLPDSITELNNLETLLLSECTNLKELSRDTKKLINLKHLDMSYCENLSYMPKGLGELTNLETLNEFVLGKDYNNVGGLSELTGLNKLRGSLRIRNLQFCSAVDLQMNAANKLMQQKSGLEKLKLEWDNLSDEPTNEGDMEDVDERVLDCLQPHSNLQKIIISGYKGVKLCNWVSSSFVGRLVSIKLKDCKRLKHLPQLDQFSYLKYLSLINLPCMEYIFDNEDDFVSSSTSFFPSLETLKIAGMPKLKGWWKLDTTTSTESTKSTEGSFQIKFPCLSNLMIFGSRPIHSLMSWQAPLLTFLKIGDSIYDVIGKDGLDGLDVVPWTNFENLSSLLLYSLPNLEYLPKCLQHATTLSCLTLLRCKNIKSLPEWIENLTSLTSLKINFCEKLTSLPEGIRRIPCLQSLDIFNCPILKERCKKDTGEDWHKIAHIPKVKFSPKLQ